MYTVCVCVRCPQVLRGSCSSVVWCGSVHVHVHVHVRAGAQCAALRCAFSGSEALYWCGLAAGGSGDAQKKYEMFMEGTMLAMINVRARARQRPSATQRHFPCVRLATCHAMPCRAMRPSACPAPAPAPGMASTMHGFSRCCMWLAGWLAGWLGVQEELSAATSNASKTAAVLKKHHEDTKALTAKVKDLEERLSLLDKVEE